jgi:hypothetical protein
MIGSSSRVSRSYGYALQICNNDDHPQWRASHVERLSYPDFKASNQRANSHHAQKRQQTKPNCKTPDWRLHVADGVGALPNLQKA